jgi:hypothetical protein
LVTHFNGSALYIHVAPYCPKPPDPSQGAETLGLLQGATTYLSVGCPIPLTDSHLLVDNYRHVYERHVEATH